MRAQRFPLHLSMRFRQAGAGAWCLGETENISRSGVLFRSDHPVDVEVPVELRLAIPTMATGNESAEIWCRGRVVRSVSKNQELIEYGLAIDQYDIKPSGSPWREDS